MSPAGRVARTKLSCPLYAADFDPLSPDFLIVGGGGGYTSSGVPNKISLIDASRRNDIKPIVDIELPKDGDSVSSIAVAYSTNTTLTAYAGINSPLADQKRGKNEHLRSFKIELPPKTTVSDLLEKGPVTLGKSETLTSLSLFKPPVGAQNEAYQRITRLSPVKTGSSAPRLAAIATGLAAENEIVVLKATSKPQSTDVLGRIDLGNSEACDVDFGPLNPEGISDSLAFCTDDKVYIQKLNAAAKTQGPPIQVYESIHSVVDQIPSKRPKFRSLRFLTPRHMLLLQNKPAKAGASLLILRLVDGGEKGSVTLQKSLNKSIKSAVGLDVCRLSESPTGERQFVIAVAGQNSSIEMLTLEYSPARGMKTFKAFNILRDVHSGPITKFCFSNFIPPPSPITKEVRPQQVKLASVGVDQTVVVHTFALRPFPPSKSKTPRYVLTPPGTSEAVQTTFSVFMAIFVIGIAAVLLQAFSEIRGAVPPALGAAEWLSPRIKEMIARPYIFADGPILPSEIPTVSAAVASPIITVVDQVKDIVSELPSVEAVSDKLHDLVQQQAEEVVPKAIVMRDNAGELVTELHHESDAVQAQAVKKWDELTEREKKGWMERLSDAGHWSAGQGESVLKGIFFSELAGVVADVVRGG